MAASFPEAGPRGLSLRADLDSRFLRKVTGEHIDGIVIEDMPPSIRFETIGKLCDYPLEYGFQEAYRPDKGLCRQTRWNAN